MNQAVLISQGNELTTGQTVDTNAAWLCRRLWELGFEVRRIITAPDQLSEIVEVISQARSLAPVVIMTGGLGPTRDDLSAQALSDALDSRLVEDPTALNHVQRYFERRNRAMSAANRKQAWIPEGCQALPNQQGSAPGIVYQSNEAFFCCLPGVPHEMRALFDDEVVPRLQPFQLDDPPVRHIIRVLGMPESKLEECLAELGPTPFEVGFRASIPSHEVKLRFSSQISAEERNKWVQRVRERIGPRAFGVDCEDLATIVGSLLKQRGETLAVAESCTAGRLASWITSVPGSSQYLMEGAVVYSNAAKVRCCGVPEAVIDTQGAVSAPVARALAHGIRMHASTTWGVGITGIAGPGGARPGKPVGTVHIAVNGPSYAYEHRYQFSGERDQVVRKSTAEAMYQLYRALISEDSGDPLI